MTVIQVYPGQTIRDVYNTAVSGDTVQINAGTYTNQPQINLRTGIDIVGNGVVVILSGNNGMVGNNVSGIVIRNIKITAEGYNTSAFSIENGSHDILIEDIDMSGYRNVIQIMGNTINGGVWDGQKDSYNITINRCKIHNSINHGLLDYRGNVHHITLSNSVLYSNALPAFFTHQGMAHHCLFYNNCVHNCADGFHAAAGLQDSKFEQNTVWNISPGKNGSLRVRYGGSESLTGPSRNNVFVNNVVYGGIYIDGSATFSGNNWSGSSAVVPQPINYIPPSSCGSGDGSGDLFMATISTNKTTYLPGEIATVSFSGATNTWDWIALYKEGVPPTNGAELAWTYLDDTHVEENRATMPLITSGTVTFVMPLLAGNYYFELFSHEAADTAVVGTPLVSVSAGKVNIQAISSGNGKVRWNNDPGRESGVSYSLEMDVGTLYTITAIPDSGYVFEKWIDSNSQIYSTASVSGTASQNMTYTAYFLFSSPGPVENGIGIGTVVGVALGTMILKAIITDISKK